MKIDWNVNPRHWKTNFECWLSDQGLWRLEEERTHGKWIFNTKPKIEGITAPTFGDQRNFFTGLFEAEWRNDNFIFKDGKTREPQRETKIKMFQEMLKVIENRADVKDTPNGLSYYIDIWKKENENNIA